MKVFVLIKDETDYNGERSVFAVYQDYLDAKNAGDYETKKAREELDKMFGGEDSDNDWVPRFYIEEICVED